MREKLTWVAEMFSTLVDIPPENEKDVVLKDLVIKIKEVWQVIATTEQNRRSFMMQTYCEKASSYKLPFYQMMLKHETTIKMALNKMEQTS